MQDVVLRCTSNWFKGGLLNPGEIDSQMILIFGHDHHMWRNVPCAEYNISKSLYIGKEDVFYSGLLCIEV